MPVTISKGGETSTIHYGPDRQRIKQVRTGAASSTVVYAGAMEVETSGTDVTVKTYLPLGLGVEIEKGSVSKVYYTHKDRQGSVMAITDEAGVLSEPMAYDSWGKRRERTGPATPDNLDGVLDNKGYTGHEMLDKLDLVHMNGRVYDPLVARFISADSLIQDPEHSQSYNRYTYVWNNPTNFTDPTGFNTEGNQPPKEEQCDRQCQELRKRTRDCSSRVGCYIIGQTGYETPTARNTKDDSGAPKQSANTTRNDIIREAALASPNPSVAHSAACVGNEGACVTAGTAFIGGGWLAGTKLGRATLAFFGFAAEIQGIADGAPLGGRGIAGAEAKGAADAAQAAGRTNGAAAELRVGDKVFTDVSTGGASRSINPKVQEALDKIPAAQRSPFHGACAEVGCLSKAADAGVNPAGGTSQAVRIRAPGKEAHGSFMDACSSCKALLDYFGVKH